MPKKHVAGLWLSLGANMRAYRPMAGALNSACGGRI